MKKFYINVAMGTGANIALASFITAVKETTDEYKFYICSPYSDVFESCDAVDGVYKSEEIRDFIFDANSDPEAVIINHRIYDMDEFIKKQINYSQAWSKLLGIPFEDTEKGSKVKSFLKPVERYPVLQKQIDEVTKAINEHGFEDYVIMQFTGGQSPLTNVPNGDWSKVPYNYENEPLKRHYPMAKAQKFIDMYIEKHPKRAIIMYQLPNEPCPKGANIVKATIPYLAYYELAKNAKGIVTIDSSLQHLTAGLVPTVVIWGHSLPEHFGYSYNTNVIQPCRRDEILYFTALGASGAKIDYISPEELLKTVEDVI